MGYRIKIQPSGNEFTVQDRESVLDGALRQGIALPYGCRDGACSTCKGRVLSGSVNYGEHMPAALSELQTAEGEALFCQAQPTSDLVIEAQEIDAAKDIVIKQLPCKVSKKQWLCHDVERLELKLPAAERLQFLAGQYMNILLDGGGHRGFSIANAPHDDEFIELHVRHISGGEFTHQVLSKLQKNTMLRIEAPLGSFFLREDVDDSIIFVGGGTGFAPIKSMVEHAIYVGLQRPMHLFWGVRSRRDLYLDELPLRWELEHEYFKYTPVLSEPSPEDKWNGEVGFVTDCVLKHYPDLTAYSLYMSGPPVMIELGRRVFPVFGLAEDQLFYDAFEFAAENSESP